MENIENIENIEHLIGAIHFGSKWQCQSNLNDTSISARTNTTPNVIRTLCLYTLVEAPRLHHEYSTVVHLPGHLVNVAVFPSHRRPSGVQ